jgi:hypothetical protein
MPLIPNDVHDGVREHRESQAMHPGTYEAAIESVLRKTATRRGRRSIQGLPARGQARCCHQMLGSFVSS